MIFVITLHSHNNPKDMATFVAQFIDVPYTYSKQERLKRKKHIDELFASGKALTVYPLRLVYKDFVFEDNTPIKAGVSVSKRLHKKAVTRNRIKRLLRETYRVQKTSIDFNKTSRSWGIMILYLSKDKPSFKDLDMKMALLLGKFENTIQKHEM